MTRSLVGTRLKRFVRDFRRAHQPGRAVAALLQSVEYPANVGSVFRLADAAGLTELILTGITPQPPQPTIDKVSRHKTRHVAWRHERDPVPVIRALRGNGWQVVGIELAEDAVPYHTFPYARKCCLVVGHEDHGLTRATLAECDSVVFLPMYGKGLSMNVHVALAIVLYHALHAAPFP